MKTSTFKVCTLLYAFICFATIEIAADNVSDDDTTTVSKEEFITETITTLPTTITPLPSTIGHDLKEKVPSDLKANVNKEFNNNAVTSSTGTPVTSTTVKCNCKNNKKDLELTKEKLPAQIKDETDEQNEAEKRKLQQDELYKKLKVMESERIEYLLQI